MSVTFRERAIVLKIKSLRDADRRYVVFTRGRGKLDLLAKGTRRGRSKMSPHMAWFGHVEIMVARGKFSDRLAGASLVRPFPGLMDSLSKSALAQAFLMTVDSLTRREQPEPRVFDLVEELFAALEAVEPPIAGDGRGPLFDAAAIKLLDAVGFGPELDRCVHCRRELGESAAMNFFRGGLECRDCRQIDSWPVLPETIGRLRRLRQQPLAESAAERPPYHHVGRLVEALLAGHAEEHFSTLNFLRRVAA